MAAGGREIEFKFRVEGPAAFEALAVAAGTRPGQPITQTNHFFDTPDRALGLRRYTLRLREEGGRFRLTAKGPAERVANRTSRAEEEIEVSAEEAQAIVHAVRSALDVLEARADQRGGALVATMRSIVGHRALRHVGSFQNARARLPVTLSVEGRALPVTFELDRTTFPGEQVHHEVEVEVEDADARAVEPVLHAFFKDAGVAWRQAPSKARRFFEAAAGRPI
ncbi:MAG TPA: CYTH domain-containing protein [Methylomirabilota bacterium]|nr:CYTH domain-containing protein [Methylomirabilota bacterium]